MPEGSRRSPPHGVPRRFRAAEWSRRGPPADQIQVRADGPRVRSLEVLCHGGRGEVILNVDQDPAELEGAEEVKLEGNDRVAVAKLNAEQRRALRTLARSPNGCPEALMLAYRFTDDMLAELAVDGLLTAQQEHVVGRSEMVV